MTKESWGEMLAKACKETGDDFNKLETTMTDEEKWQRFDTGYGGAEGVAFTAWGENYVYFPVVYDGAEWVGYAPRHPCTEKTQHQGGY